MMIPKATTYPHKADKSSGKFDTFSSLYTLVFQSWWYPSVAHRRRGRRRGSDWTRTASNQLQADSIKRDSPSKFVRLGGCRA